MELRLRPARAEDRERVFEWANQPLVRQQSFEPDPVPWEKHVQWFEAVLKSRGPRLFVVEGLDDSAWTPIGQWRFDERDGEVGVALDVRYRGRRLATPAIKAGVEVARTTFLGDRLIAHIKPDNLPSVRAFAEAGFRLVGPTTYKGHPALEYEHILRPQP